MDQQCSDNFEGALSEVILYGVKSVSGFNGLLIGYALQHIPFGQPIGDLVGFMDGIVDLYRKDSFAGQFKRRQVTRDAGEQDIVPIDLAKSGCTGYAVALYGGVVPVVFENFEGDQFVFIARNPFPDKLLSVVIGQHLPCL